ncbi:MAG: (2Fe-2S)-binding protein [Cyanobacteria bacterium]|nr:(2Fe-2S)-binding protein [Cyanobacteriota bacterium]
MTGAQNTCPHCGAKGARVELTTVKALLTELALRQFEPGPHSFCPGATCSVVYFAADGQVYTTTDVRVPVWQKQPAGARRICYCFDENEASMAREVVETGRCGAVQRVRDHIAAGRCACEVRNPRGTCCLGEVMKAVARVESECSSEVEK